MSRHAPGAGDEAARRLHGIKRWDQIKYAVLEVSGGISVIPNERAQGTG